MVKLLEKVKAKHWLMNLAVEKRKMRVNIVYQNIMARSKDTFSKFEKKHRPWSEGSW